MNKKHKIVLWVIVTIVVSSTFFVLLRSFSKLFPVSSFVFAFDLHFILMAWYAFSLPLLKLDYTSKYYVPKTIENNGKIYEYFGVSIFRSFLKIIGWNKIGDKSNGVVKKNLNTLIKREKHTREAELAHLLLFFHFIMISIYVSINNSAFWLLVLNVPLHLYPVFVQRHNRPRYLKLIKSKTWIRTKNKAL